jgi:hypothetical protein
MLGEGIATLAREWRGVVKQPSSRRRCACVAIGERRSHEAAYAGLLAKAVAHRAETFIGCSRTIMVAEG